MNMTNWDISSLLATFDTFMFASIVEGQPIKQLQATVLGQRRVGRAVEALEIRVESQGWFA